ncbi:MAG: Ppx/GppA phosphatase family protein, partial [Egibacteraceae bacterium]
AQTLFDGTRGLHRLDDDARELLDHAALLHDVGEHVSTEGHAKHSAYLIEHGRLRGFSPGEVAVLACLGRYHRKGEPTADFGPFELMSKARRRQVAALVPLLQVAHGLDHGRTCAVTRLGVEVTPAAVRLRLTAASDGHLERWGAEQRGRRFARTFRRRLEVVVDSRPSTRAV